MRDSYPLNGQVPRTLGWRMDMGLSEASGRLPGLTCLNGIQGCILLPLEKMIHVSTKLLSVHCLSQFHQLCLLSRDHWVDCVTLEGKG